MPSTSVYGAQKTTFLPKVEAKYSIGFHTMTPIHLSIFFTYLVTLGAAAQDAPERSDLALALRQITAIEQLAYRASSGAVHATGARYSFDYSAFVADLERVRQGIHSYLSPSRAQPADLVELAGRYRAEAPYSSHSDEHD